MLSNNGLTICKNRFLSFISKGFFALYMTLLMILVLPCAYLMCAFWSEIPLAIKIVGPILFFFILIGIVITSLNGMIITKKGTIVFIPDFRIKRVRIKDLNRIAVNFSQWENNKYSVMVKFVYLNGKAFKKDYSNHFASMNNKMLAMPMYTVAKHKVDKICQSLSDLNICVVTVIDKDRNIIYQSKLPS